MLKNTLLSCMLALLVVNGCSCSTMPVEDLAELSLNAPILVSEQLKNNGAVVRVEFALSLEDKNDYPEAFEAFIEAAKEWVLVAPVEIAIIIPTEGQETVWSIIGKRPGVLLLDFAPTIKNTDNDDDLLGTFSWNANTLRLDMGDFYQDGVFNADLAKAVAMHELGHMFGLTHISNSGDGRVEPGGLIVDHGAEKLMMHWSIPTNYVGLKISAVELEYALAYIKSVLPTKLNRF